MIHRIVVFALASLAVDTALADNLVKWVDKDGKVNYSDKEPAEQARSVTHLKKQKQTPTPLAAVDKPATANGEPLGNHPKTPAEEAAALKERQVKKAEAEVDEKKKKEDLAMKEKNCSMARNQSQQLEAGGRFTYAGPNGETLFMDEKQLEKAKVDARNNVDAWCKG